VRSGSEAGENERVKATKQRSFRATLVRDGSSCHIPVPFDPREAFGRARPPVTVTLNGYSYRSTLFSMGGRRFVPLRRSHREAAGVAGDETLKVTLALDEAPRVVTPPLDLARALRAAPPAWERFRELSFTHQREHVEAIDEAKRPETRARRIENAVAALKSRPPRTRR